MADNRVLLFRAIGDGTRMAIIEELGRKSLRAGELAERVGISAPVVSRHLRILMDVGLVADERVPEDARLRVFRLQPEQIAAIGAWVDQVEAHWQEQLGSFKKHVGRRKR